MLQENAVERISCPQLKEAAARVVTSWDNASGDAVNREEVEAVAAHLAVVIEHRVAGNATPIGPEGQSVLGRRLLDLIRAHVVAGWKDAAHEVPSEQILQTMAAIEQVREELEPNWSEYFASRLTGPGGLDLVVEVAHDLRSPLSSILFLAETLQRGQSGEVNDVQRRQLGLIYSAALGLSSVASDVLELARGGDRLVESEPSPFSVTEVLEAVHAIVRPMAEEKELGVRLLPPGTDHRLGHPLALSRVLLNLTTNALKFTDEGFVEIVTQARGPSRLEFSVRDTGNGINPEILGSLYQVFRRARGRDGYCFSGTGLGLAICRKLVEAMGSTLQVESRPEWGTRFYFDIDLPPASHF